MPEQKKNAVVRSVQFAVLLILIDSLLVFFIIPLYISLVSNVLYAGTLWPTVVDIVRELTEISVFFLSYAFLIHTWLSYGIRWLGRTTLICVGATVYRYVANLLFFYIREGGTADGEILWDVMMGVVVPALLESLQLGVVILLCFILLRRKEREREGTGDVPRGPSSDISKTTVRSCVIAAAGVISAARVVNRVIYDIRYGAPTDVADATWMVVYYMADILIGVLGYFFMISMVTRPEKSKGRQR